jgi:hypothetical protein
MKKYTIYLITALILVFGLSTGLALAASMNDYCVLPPYVKRNVRPNIMIILDNSEVNGAPAYTDATDPESITDGLTGFLLYNAATAEPYPGLHKPELWYYYNGNRFDPSNPSDVTDPNRDQAVFEGNLLNWLTTSRYDLIQTVLVGGKSASRQANAHTLVGYNASDPYDSDPADPAWDKRIFVYEGEDTNTYACEFIVNDADKGDLTIMDSGAYFTTFGYTCGLILPTPVRPAAGYRRIASAETAEDTLLAALSPAEDVSPAGGEPGPLMRGLYRFINKVFSIGASPAYAAKPLGLDNKSFSGVPDATRFQSYSGHQFFATGGVGSYSWTLSGQPSGMSIDNSGYLSGWPTDVPAATYTLTITVTDQDSPVKSDSADVDIYLYGSVVSMVSPTNGGTLTDAVRFEPYSYQAVATGGTGSYTWSIIAGSLPPGLTLNNATGLISGTTTDWPGSMYNLTLQVDDGYETATAAVSITVQGQWFQIGAPMGDLPEGKQNEPYVGYTCEASGGSLHRPGHGVHLGDAHHAWLLLDAHHRHGHRDRGVAGCMALSLRERRPHHVAQRRLQHGRHHLRHALYEPVPARCPGRHGKLHLGSRRPPGRAHHQLDDRHHQRDDHGHSLQLDRVHHHRGRRPDGRLRAGEHVHL